MVTHWLSYTIALLLAAARIAIPGTAVAGGGEPNLAVQLMPTPPDAYYRGNAHRTGEYRADPITGTPSVTWTFRPEGDITSAPLVAGDLLFLGDDQYIYALDRKSGKLLWNYHLSGAGTPALVDGTLYFGASQSALYAMDPLTGRIRWKILSGTHRPGSPIIAGGQLLFGGGDFRSLLIKDMGYLAAVDAATGNDLWSVPVKNRVMTPPAVSDGVVFFGFGAAGSVLSGGGFHALRLSDRKELWNIQNIASVPGAPAVAGGQVYFGTRIGSAGSMMAVDQRTGEVLWTFPSNGAAGTPAVSNGRVFFGTSADRAGTFYALDARNGTPLWQHRVGAWFDAPPAVAGDVVYAADSSGTLRAYGAADGRELWTFKAPRGRHAGGPLPVGRTIYVTFDNILYALE